MKNTYITLSICLFFATILVKSTEAPLIRFSFQSNPKVSPYVANLMIKNGRTTAQVMVFLKDRAKISEAKKITNQAARKKTIYKILSEKAISSQKSLVNFLTTEGFEFRQFYIVNMITVYNATPNLIKQIADRDDVERIQSDPQISIDRPVIKADRPHVIPEETGIQSNLIFIGADRVWNEFHAQGENIVIGGQDTGVQWDHPALIEKYRGKNQGKISGTSNVDHDYNWHDAIHKPQTTQVNKCGLNLEVPCDDDQHGTHTMGTMVGSEGDNQIGVAPKANWIACRNMDSGYGTPSSYFECFEFLFAPYPVRGNNMTDGDVTKAPHIINNSWGCTISEGCDGTEFIPILDNMKAAGIMVVASAGNEGPNCSTIESAPAHHSSKTFSVGAFDHRAQNIAEFSSRGPSLFDQGIGPDIVAPGVDIRSAVPGNIYEQNLWNGTSMAGPHIVGTIALMWSANPKLIGDVDTTARILRETAVHKQDPNQSCGGVSGSQIPNNTYGYGVVDAYAAVTKAVNLK